MKARAKGGSRLLKEAYEIAQGLHSVGAIDDARLHEYREMCIEEEVPVYSSSKIKALRRRNKRNQAQLASILNASVATVKQWELGARRPSSPYLRLLQVLDRKGPEAFQF